MAASPSSTKAPAKPDIFTNGEVKKALLDYNRYQELILDLALGKGRLNEPPPYGFGNLTRVEHVRAAIDAVVRQPVGSVRATGGKLDSFRRQLVYVVAASAREDSLFLILFLYCALMERHAACADDPAYLVDTDPSAAGEYLLLCLSVQAAYSDFASYLFIVARFGSLIRCLRKVPGNCADLTPYFMAAAAAPAESEPNWPSPLPRATTEGVVVPVRLGKPDSETDDAREKLATALRTQLKEGLQAGAESVPVVVLFLDFEYAATERKHSVFQYFKDTSDDGRVIAIALRTATEHEKPAWIATKVSVTLILEERLLSSFVKYFDSHSAERETVTGDRAGTDEVDDPAAGVVSRKALATEDGGKRKIPQSSLLAALDKLGETAKDASKATVDAVRDALAHFFWKP